MRSPIRQMIRPRSDGVMRPHGPSSMALRAARTAAEGAGRRWAEMLDGLTGLLTGAGCVLIDGPPAPRARDDRDRRLCDERAGIVVDLHDTDWPVIRRVTAPLAAGGSWYLTETRAFFACRAATWDAKFGDDLPAYQMAVAESGIGPGVA